MIGKVGALQGHRVAVVVGFYIPELVGEITIINM